MEVFGPLSMALAFSLTAAIDIQTMDDMQKACKSANKSEGMELIPQWPENYFTISYSPALNVSGACKKMNLRLPSNESLLYSALTENGYKQVALYNLTDPFYVRTMDAQGVKSDKAKTHFFAARGPPHGDVVDQLIYGMDCKANGTIEFFINVGDGDRNEQQKALDYAGFQSADVSQCSAEWTEIQPEENK